MTPIDIQKIEQHLKGRHGERGIIREALFFDTVDSTNRIAREMGLNGLPGEVAIFAESQKQGKGRLGRQWISPHGVNLYLSLFLRPHQPPREFPLFSMATSVALVHAIRSITGLVVSIKWPNDIIWNDKKVAGILIESECHGDQAAPLVIGMGVNVNMDPADFPPEIYATAASLKMALGQPIDRSDLAIAILDAFSDQHLLLGEGKKDLLVLAMKRYCQTLGRKIMVQTAQRQFEGWALDIEEDGTLLIKMGDHSQRKILVGDITHLREIVS